MSQSAYSTPSIYTLDVEGMGIKVGPPPNSTGTPLDTKIVIDALTSVSLADFHITPSVSIAHSDIENSGPITYLNSFYPARPLKPATYYTVSVIVTDKPISWGFTTTNEVFRPSISFQLATNAFWIALSASLLGTLISVYMLRLRGKAHASSASKQ